MRTGTRIVLVRLESRSSSVPLLVDGETLTLQQATSAAEANNRAIRAARLEHDKALKDVSVARTYRLPVFSVSTLGSQSLAHLGPTFPLGSLGVCLGIGPIPGKTTTLTGPLQAAGIFYATIAFASHRCDAMRFTSEKLTVPGIERKLLRRAMIKSALNPVLRLTAILLAWVNTNNTRDVLSANPA